MASPDIDMIRDIPGYKVILKAVLKTQIQQLVEQLSSHTDEETVILTANTCDGTLSHLGSESGRSFLDDHEDMKSQFLGFCLKRCHMMKENRKKDLSSMYGYSQDTLQGSRSGYRSRNISDSRNRGSPYHREKVPGQKSTATYTSGSSVDEVSFVNRTKGETGNDSEPKNKVDNESNKPSDINTSYDELSYSNQIEEQSLETGSTIATSNVESSKTGEEESNSHLHGTDGVNIKTEPENDSDVEILVEVNPADWDLNTSTGVNFDPARMAGMSTSQSEYPPSRWDPNSSSSLSIGMTFDPAGIAGTSASTASVAYSFKKRFIGRQTSEQSHSSLSHETNCLTNSSTWLDKSCNLKNTYLTACDNISAYKQDASNDLSAYKHDAAEDISLVHDLSIKHEKISENEDSNIGDPSDLMFDGKQRRYKPVSHLTEAQRQRRRLMDRERQRRRRERIRAANVDFYQMYQSDAGFWKSENLPVPNNYKAFIPIPVTESP